jgi:hypothetical protein
MFHVYRFDDIPNHEAFITIFNDLAIANGFDGIHFIATICSDIILNNKFIFGKVGVDVFMRMRYGQGILFFKKGIFAKIERKIKKVVRDYLKPNNHIDSRSKPLIFDYKRGVEKMNMTFNNEKHIPCVFPNWDNTARSGNKAMIFRNATPEIWKVHLESTVCDLLTKANRPQIIVIKSWNEWAEGNYLEPDAKFGLKWLLALKGVKEQLERKN